MGFEWTAAALAGLVVAVIALVVHGLAVVVTNYVGSDRLQGLPYVAIGAGAVFLVLQVLPLGSLSGLAGQLATPTPVYVGVSVVVLTTGAFAVGIWTIDGNWNAPLVVVWPVVAVLPLYPIALLMAGIQVLPSSVRLQWQALDQVTVTVTLLVVVGSFTVAGYYGRGELSSTPLALVPPVVAAGARIAAQATIGAGFDGLSVVSYVILAPVVVPVGLVLYLVGSHVESPRSETTGLQ